MRSCLSGETLSVEPERLFSSSDVLLSDNMEPRDSRPVGGFPILAAPIPPGGLRNGDVIISHKEAMISIVLISHFRRNIVSLPAY